MTFNAAFNTALEKSGLSIKEAARAFRTAPGTITRWAGGHSSPAKTAQPIILSYLEGVTKTRRDQTDLKRIARLLVKRVEALEIIRQCLETKRPIPDVCHEVILETAKAYREEAKAMGIVETTLYDEWMKTIT